MGDFLPQQKIPHSNHILFAPGKLSKLVVTGDCLCAAAATAPIATNLFYANLYALFTLL
jgi:hypothetical protein